MKQICTILIKIFCCMSNSNSVPGARCTLVVRASARAGSSELCTSMSNPDTPEFLVAEAQLVLGEVRLWFAFVACI
jgi:hypothetical protein